MPTKTLESRLEQQKISVVIGNADDEDDKLLVAYEYQEISKTPNTVHCWIPAAPGGNFCVHWGYDGKKRAKRGQGLKCYVFLDEVPAAVGYLPPDFVQGGGEMEITGFQTHEGTELPFCFGRREVVDDDREIYLGSKSTETLGMIKVVVYWAYIDEEGEPDDEPDMDGDECERNRERILEAIPERKMKARHELGAVLGNSRPSESLYIKHKTKRADKMEYTFIFHYAAADWLKSEGIVEGLQRSNPHASRCARDEQSELPLKRSSSSTRILRGTAHTSPESQDEALEADRSQQNYRHQRSTSIHAHMGRKRRAETSETEVMDVDAWDESQHEMRRKRKKGWAEPAELIDSWRLGC